MPEIPKNARLVAVVSQSRMGLSLTIAMAMLNNCDRVVRKTARTE